MNTSEKSALKFEIRALKKDVGAVSRFALIYLAIFALVPVPVMIGLSAWYSAQRPDAPLAEIEALVRGQLGLATLLAWTAGVLYILIRRRSQLWRHDLACGGTAMTPRVFASAVVLLFTCQILSLVLDPAVSTVARALGYSMKTTDEAMAAMGTGPLILLYTCLLGPVVEEVLFRGVVMSRLQPHGRAFAIVLSALLFGLFHGSLSQSLFAFCCGLVLGYIAMEYSIYWAMLLHILNNAVIVTLMNGSYLQTALILGIGGLGGALVLWRSGPALAAWLRSHRSRPGSYRAVLTTPSLLLFVAVALFQMSTAFSPLG